MDQGKREAAIVDSTGTVRYLTRSRRRLTPGAISRARAAATPRGSPTGFRSAVFRADVSVLH